MKKLLLALAFCLISSGAWAQCNGAFPANNFCGTGSTSTPPTAQASPIQYSVVQFGAKGNGVADDTAAIQAAFTAAFGVINGQVFFPCGTYLITSTITMNSVGFQGMGLCATIKTTNNIPMLQVTVNAGGTHYSGVHLLGSSTGNASQVGFQVSSSITNWGHNIVDHIYCDGVTTCIENAIPDGNVKDWNNFHAINTIGVLNAILFDDGSGTGNVFDNMNLVGAVSGPNAGGNGIAWGNSVHATPSIGDITVDNIEFGGGFLNCFSFAPTSYGFNITLQNWQCDGGPTNYLSTSTAYSIKYNGFNLGGAVSTKTTSASHQVAQDLNSFERRYGRVVQGVLSTPTSIFNLKLPVNQVNTANGAMVEIVGSGFVANRGPQIRTTRFSVLNGSTCTLSVSTLDTFTDGVSPFFSYTTSAGSAGTNPCTTTFNASMSAGTSGSSYIVLGIRIVGDQFDVEIQ